MTDLTVRPSRINAPEEDLVDLRRRIAATRWPEQETVTDASQGVRLATAQGMLSRTTIGRPSISSMRRGIFGITNSARAHTNSRK